MKSSTLRMIPPVPVALAVVSVVVWLVFPSPLVHGVVIGALVVTVALVGGVVFIGPRMRERLQSHLERPALPSKTWDYAMQAETLDGEVVEFTRFSGRVLVLNLWATWCTPCLAEMPSLARLQERGSDLEVELACVTQEGKGVVESFSRGESWVCRSTFSVGNYLSASQAGPFRPHSSSTERGSLLCATSARPSGTTNV